LSPAGSNLPLILVEIFAIIFGVALVGASVLMGASAILVFY